MVNGGMVAGSEGLPGEGAHVYPFADGSLASPSVLHVLGPPAAAPCEGPARELAFEPLSMPRSVPWAGVACGELAGRRTRILSVALGDGAMYLRVGGVGHFAVTADGTRIVVDAERADQAMMASGLFGPAAALALARRNIYVLHASAVQLPGRGVVAFLGDSGDGKSTLAALLARLDAARVADDQLLLSDPVDPHVLPHFPQLKLQPCEQDALTALPARLPLAALVRLRPAAPGTSCGWRWLSPSAAFCELARHTIATSLFPPDLLATQLDFAAGVVSQVPVGELLVPRRLDVGAEVLGELGAIAA